MVKQQKSTSRQRLSNNEFIYIEVVNLAIWKFDPFLYSMFIDNKNQQQNIFKSNFKIMT